MNIQYPTRNIQHRIVEAGGAGGIYKRVLNADYADDADFEKIAQDTGDSRQKKILISKGDKMIERKIITTDKAPKAIGPYSQALLAGNTLYISGQIGMDPATGKLVADSAAEQTKQALENIKAILAAADMELVHVVQMQVFLADIADFAKMNEVYASYFTGDFPTRAAFQAADLPAGAKVEILATAIK